MANIPGGADGRAHPQLGSVALQSGQVAAENVLADFAGKPRKSFHYHDKGIMAMIGRGAAIAEVGAHRHELHGVIAFSAWLGVHAMLMTGVRNRIDAFIAWGWDNFTSGHGPQVLDRSEAARIDWGDDETPAAPAAAGVSSMSLPWPVRSVIAGAAGTTTMTLAYAAERRLRKSHHGQLDYDDSLVPGQIVASVMHLPHVTDREDHELGLALRWGYGSAFGIMHGLLHRRLREPWAAAVFGGMLMSATVSLFPLLGRTPPPWRWPADVLATSLGTHVAYVTAVAVVDDAVRRV